MLAQIQTTALKPFGLQIEPEEEGANLAEFDVDMLSYLVLEHRGVVLRGFKPMGREAFEQYGHSWGDILMWNFGAILDVVVDPQAKNYLFTHGSVPHHWDGAFAHTVPFLQIFQCLAAPRTSQSQGEGGETVFCDTTRVWEAATPEQQARWQQTTITYNIEKVSHFGGEIKADLVSSHPITGQTTLRFAEPHNEETAPLNPLHLEVEGNTLDSLIEELQPMLYNPEFCYIHDWREGDYVIADNHALLHARKAFQTNAARHLQRIHIQ